MMELMLSRSEIIEKIVAASFLNEPTKEIITSHIKIV